MPVATSELVRITRLSGCLFRIPCFKRKTIHYLRMYQYVCKCVKQYGRVIWCPIVFWTLWLRVNNLTVYNFLCGLECVFMPACFGIFLSSKQVTFIINVPTSQTLRCLLVMAAMFHSNNSNQMWFIAIPLRSWSHLGLIGSALLQYMWQCDNNSLTFSAPIELAFTFRHPNTVNSRTGQGNLTVSKLIRSKSGQG